jgi:hypothetical protein
MEKQINPIRRSLEGTSMSSNSAPPTFKGRSFGILLLVVAQSLVGVIHVVLGFWLLSGPRIQPFTFFSSYFFSNDVYAAYTILFGIFTLIFTIGLWTRKRWGWVGTAAVALFVIAANALTLLDLPSVPGIPKFAGYGEIPYSVLVLLYISQKHTRAKYKIHRA